MDWFILLVVLAGVFVMYFPWVAKEIVQRMDARLINKPVDVEGLETVSVFQLLHGKDKLSSDDNVRLFHQVDGEIVFINAIYRRTGVKFVLLTPSGEIPVDGRYLVLVEFAVAT